MTFEKPYMLGLLLKKSDKLYIDRNLNFTINATEFFYDTTGCPKCPADEPDCVLDTCHYEREVVGNETEHRLFTESSSKRIEMQFDFRNQNMKLYRRVASNMYWVMIAIIVTQFILLIWRGVGLLPVWILIEYLQLVSFMPIYNFKFIPYLYDAFKPALVSHMIIFDDTPFYDGLDNDYFNKNYEYYWLSVGRLFQAFAFYFLFLIIIVVLHFVTFVFYKINIGTERSKAWM